MYVFYILKLNIIKEAFYILYIIKEVIYIICVLYIIEDLQYIYNIFIF